MCVCEFKLFMCMPMQRQSFVAVAANLCTINRMCVFLSFPVCCIHLNIGHAAATESVSTGVGAMFGDSDDDDDGGVVNGNHDDDDDDDDDDDVDGVPMLHVGGGNNIRSGVGGSAGGGGGGAVPTRQLSKWEESDDDDDDVDGVALKRPRNA